MDRLINKHYLHLSGILVLGLLVRIAFNNINYSSDAESFIVWAHYLADGNSLSNLYEFLPGNYLTYPPVYYYLLKIIGEVISTFNIWQNVWLSYLIVKLPVFTAEIVITIVIYLIARSFSSLKAALVACAFFFLNPALIYISSVWGQIDSVVTMAGFLSLYLFFKKQYQVSFLIYTLGIVVKPHLLSIVPLIIVLALKLKKREIIKGIALLFLASLVVFMPIISQKGFLWTFKYFYQLPHQYPYTSVYAYNVWAPLGFIISDNLNFLIPVSLKFISLLVITVIALLVIRPISKRSHPNLKTVIFAAFILFLNFALFSTRVHSRYLVYSLGFLSPFSFKYPKITFFLTFLIFANLLLPNNEKALSRLTAVLNKSEAIWLFTLYGIVLFVYSMRIYKELLRERAQS